MFLENVEEFCDWGPIDEHGQPIKAERGRTFKSFIAALSTGLPADHPDMPEILQSIGEFVPVESLVRGLGYNVEWRERIAANAGAPTIRKHLYLVARSDGCRLFGLSRCATRSRQRSSSLGAPQRSASTGAIWARRSSGTSQWH